MKKKFIMIIGAIAILAISLFFIINNFSDKKETESSQEIKVVPLDPGERQKVAFTILSSEFVEDIPEKNPIALTFFSFENGERIWRDSFLIGRGQLLTEGTPTIHLTLHSKYISEFEEDNLCDIIKEANKNRDLGFHTEYSTASLLIKYAGMMEHRDCFGF